MKKEIRKFSKEDKEFILKNYKSAGGNMTATELAKKFNRNVGTIYSLYYLSNNKMSNAGKKAWQTRREGNNINKMSVINFVINGVNISLSQDAKKVYITPKSINIDF